MDVTPTPKMFAAMQALTDALCGEEPHGMILGPAAMQVRQKRQLTMGLLHKLVAVSMREGLNRGIIEAKARKAGEMDKLAKDAEDRNALARARDDAERGAQMVQIPGGERVKH